MRVRFATGDALKFNHLFRCLPVLAHTVHAGQTVIQMALFHLFLRHDWTWRSSKRTRETHTFGILSSEFATLTLPIRAAPKMTQPGHVTGVRARLRNCQSEILISILI